MYGSKVYLRINVIIVCFQSFHCGVIIILWTDGYIIYNKSLLYLFLIIINIVISYIIWHSLRIISRENIFIIDDVWRTYERRDSTYVHERYVARILREFFAKIDVWPRGAHTYAASAAKGSKDLFKRSCGYARMRVCVCVRCRVRQHCAQFLGLNWNFSTRFCDIFFPATHTRFYGLIFDSYASVYVIFLRGNRV